jgi:hypothetical protein
MKAQTAEETSSRNNQNEQATNEAAAESKQEEPDVIGFSEAQEPPVVSTGG